MQKKWLNDDKNLTKDDLDKHINDIRQVAQEVHEMETEVATCDTRNVIHAAKLQRLGNAHADKAKVFRGKLKAQINRDSKQRNSNKKNGIKHMAKTIGDKCGQALTAVERGRDTPDGGSRVKLRAIPRRSTASSRGRGRRSMMEWWQTSREPSTSSSTAMPSIVRKQRSSA